LSEEEAGNSSLIVVASILTIVSGALVLFGMTIFVWNLLPSLYKVSGLVREATLISLVSGIIGDLTIAAVAIVGGLMVLAKKNLIFGVIGATIPLGSSLYYTVYDAMLAYTGLLTVEPSDVLGYLELFLTPLILVLSILSVVLFVHSRTSSVHV
jgi:hypothetical protein